MPWDKRKANDKWEVYNSETGEVKGTHDSESEADDQLAALYIHASPEEEKLDKLMFIPITKVNEQRREVWGWGAVEEPDNADEILDYESSKPRFLEWSQRAQKRSGGRSLGNVRSMHQNIAAGKLIDLRAVDSKKGFWVGAKIVDDGEWKKVQEGVYTGFSVGGSYERRWPDYNNPGKIRYTARPAELSIVDAPCINSATFDIVKMDGTTLRKRFTPTSGKNMIKVVSAPRMIKVVYGDELNKAEWDENKHPRGKGGEFTSGGGGGSGRASDGTKFTKPEKDVIDWNDSPNKGKMHRVWREAKSGNRKAEVQQNVDGKTYIRLTENGQTKGWEFVGKKPGDENIAGNKAEEYLKGDIKKVDSEGDDMENTQVESVETTTNLEKEPMNKMEFIGEMTSDEHRQLLQEALNRKFPRIPSGDPNAAVASSGGRFWVNDFSNDCVYTWDADKTYEIPYTIGENNMVSFGEPTEVRRHVSYEPVGTVAEEPDELSAPTEDEIAETAATFGKADWEEGKHPRNKNGEFTSGGGGGSEGEDEWADDDETVPEGKQFLSTDEMKQKLKEDKNPPRPSYKSNKAEDTHKSDSTGDLQKADIPGAPEPIAEMPLPSKVGPGFSAEQMPAPSVPLEINPNSVPSQDVLANHAVMSKDLTAAFDAWLPKVGAMIKTVVAQEVAKALGNTAVTAPAQMIPVRKPKFIKVERSN